MPNHHWKSIYCYLLNVLLILKGIHNIAYSFFYPDFITTVKLSLLIMCDNWVVISELLHGISIP